VDAARDADGNHECPAIPQKETLMDFPLANGGIIKHDGVTAATSLGTTITTSATNNTKGAWTEVSAAAPNSVVGFWLCVYLPLTPAVRWLFDVAYGASNIVIVDNLWIRQVTCTGGQRFWIPLHVPAGEPVQVRAQNYRTGGVAGTCEVSIIWQCGTMVSATPFGHAATYGAATASTSGTDVDPGATANTKGAYSELSAATTHDIRSMLLCFGHSSTTALGQAFVNTSSLVDVAIGAAGSELVRLPDLPLIISAWLDSHANPVMGPFDVFIPAGTRLSARAQCSSADALYRTLALVIVGFN
jgi:hypothetical protein